MIVDICILLTLHKIVSRLCRHYKTNNKQIIHVYVFSTIKKVRQYQCLSHDHLVNIITNVQYLFVFVVRNFHHPTFIQCSPTTPSSYCYEYLLNTTTNYSGCMSIPPHWIFSYWFVYYLPIL